MLEDDGNISLIFFYDASTGLDTDESDIFWTGFDALINYFSLGILCYCYLYLSYFWPDKVLILLFWTCILTSYFLTPSSPSIKL